jgi:propanol-preferring alcohol dehydrogenase
MRAMVLCRTGAAEERLLGLEDVDDPAPARGQVLIEVDACGVCRTDLHLLEGEVSAPLPLIPGHQAAGRIVTVGEDVRDIAVGDVVGVGWLASTCGKCSYCTSGRENLCPYARFTGRDVAGGYARRMIANARFVFPLPHGMAAADAAPLLCAGIIGYRSLRLSEIKPGGRLGLAGFGASAHLALQVALHWRCDVYVFTREEHHRRFALEMGARWAGAIGDDPGVPLEAIVTFAPAGEIVPPLLERLSPGGTLAINAIHMGDIPAFPYERLYHERTLRSVANFTRRDAQDFLALAAEIPVRAQVERRPLAEANEALLAVKRGEVSGAMVLDIG